jgi:uncharacterized protein YceK
VLPATAVVTFTTNVPTYVPTASQGIFWWTSLLLGLVTFSSRRYLRRMNSRLLAIAIAMVVLSGISGLSGCSSSVTSTSLTPAGSYPITVTLTGAQHDNYGYNEVFRADLPYQMNFTLTVQ